VQHRPASPPDETHEFVVATTLVAPARGEGVAEDVGLQLLDASLPSAVCDDASAARLVQRTPGPEVP
jgi:hypothetical protein